MADTANPLPRRSRPWVLTFFSLPVIGGLVSMPMLAGKAGAGEMPGLVRFIGHFHPFLLHLPIGVFMMILFQELGAIFFRRGRVPVATSLFPMFFGAASAVLAAITGFLLYHGEAEEFGGSALAERHLWGGLVFSVIAVFTFVIKAWTDSLSGNQAWYRLMLFSSVGVMGFAGHDGASLTHGSDYLTKHAPAPLRRILGLPTGKPGVPQVKPPADQVAYADIVAPIFERRCVQCHKEGKAKGKFRMDTFELLVKGGKEGPGIVPGNSAESNIIVRMELPEDDDDHMPPEGKAQVEDAELLVIKWWLDSGADPAKKISEYDVPAPVSEALGCVSDHVASEPVDVLKSEFAGLASEFPGALSFESQESGLVTFSAVSMRGKFHDADFGKFAPVLPALVSADLSATLITDKSVVLLGEAKKLRRLRLAETGITDAAIDSLVGLPVLESLNLHGTKVTDSGILKLATMPGLKRLYLWQTAVTPEGVKALQEKLPDCGIVVSVASPAE